MRRAPSRTHRLTWRSADVEERRLPRGTFPFVNSSGIGATPRMAWLPAGHMGGRGRARWLQHLKPAASGGANMVTSEGANEAAQGDVAWLHTHRHATPPRRGAGGRSPPPHPPRGTNRRDLGPSPRRPMLPSDRAFCKLEACGDLTYNTKSPALNSRCRLFAVCVCVGGGYVPMYAPRKVNFMVADTCPANRLASCMARTSLQA